MREIRVKGYTDYKLGIFSWFGFVLPLPVRLELIKKAGFDMTTLWWEDEIGKPGIPKEAMPAMVSEAGLILENIHVPYDKCDDFWNASSIVRNTAIEKHIDWVNDCAFFDIPMMVMHISDTYAPEKPSKYGIDSIAKILAVAEQLGIILALENTGRADFNQFILEELPSPNLGLCYDSSHDWLYSSNKGQLLKDAGDRLVTVHFSDNDGQKDRHWLPGEGTIDWQQIAGAFPQDYKGCITLEVCPKYTKSIKTPGAFIECGYKKAEWVKNLILSRQGHSDGK